MSLPLLLPFLTPIVKAIFPDKESQDKAMIKVMDMSQRGELSSLEQQMKIITAEANGDSWLQRNWRPLTMVVFTSLIVAKWLGITAEGITPELETQLLEIIKIGLGGYVLGRSGEKIMKAYKTK